MKRILGVFFSMACLAAALPARAAAPETVHVTYHVKPGKLGEFITALKAHYPACRKLGLVLDHPHLILSGTEDGGKPRVVEVLTWRDADAPDSVSAKYPEVQAIWDRLNALVEKRGGKPGVEVEEVEIVAEGQGASKQAAELRAPAGTPAPRGPGRCWGARCCRRGG